MRAFLQLWQTGLLSTGGALVLTVAASLAAEPGI